MVGAFGAIFAAAQAALLERGAWADLLASSASSSGGSGGLAAAAGALAAFTAALFTFSALVPVALIWGGAAALNLSLLTSDLWAAAARVLLFGGFGGAGAWFTGSLVLVAAGLALYASAGSPKAAGPEAPAAWPSGAAAAGSSVFLPCATAEASGASAAAPAASAGGGTPAAWARRVQQLLSIVGGRGAWTVSSGAVGGSTGGPARALSSSPECRLLLGRPSLDGMEPPHSPGRDGSNSGSSVSGAPRLQHGF
jgi:hypothetical protein